MAITTISIPSGINIAYRPIVYTWSSSASNLKYCIAEVLVNSVRVSAISVQLDAGSSANFTLDVSGVCQSNLDFDLQAINSSGVITPVNSQKTIQLKVYEVTENPSTGVLVTDYDPSDANNSSYQYFSTPALVVNWIVSHLDYATFNLSDYFLTSSTKKFLTDSPFR